MQMSVKKSMSNFVFCFHFIISKLWCDFVYCGTKCSDDKISNSFGFFSWYFCIELLWHWKKRRKWHEKSNAENKFFIIYNLLGFFSSWNLKVSDRVGSTKTCEKEFVHEIFTSFVLFIWNLFLFFFSVFVVLFSFCFSV